MYKVSIVGRPNVGKSMLFNTLIGERKAIVEKTPGVTRDILEGFLELKDGKGVKVIDTGGIDWGGRDFFQEEILKIVGKIIQESDLILFVVDVKTGLLPEDYKIAEYLIKHGKKVILVVNKVESKEDKNRAYEFYALGFDKVVFVSAKENKNIDELKEMILREAEGRLEEQKEKAPIKIAVLGRPNVGKSTLVNKLLGEDRLIVSEIPGTTTDCVDVLIRTPEGREYILVDTPGIRRRTHIDKRMEKFAVDKALETLRKVDLVLFMITAEEGVTNQDQRLLRQVDKHNKACILLINKWDIFDNRREAGNLMMENIKYGVRFMPWLPMLTISAKTGRRVDKILPLVDEIYEEYSKRIKTSELNKILHELRDNYSFNVKGKRLKFFYATQVDVRPPTFVLFVNVDPETIPKSLYKFFKRLFQKSLGFERVPVEVLFRERH